MTILFGFLGLVTLSLIFFAVGKLVIHAQGADKSTESVGDALMFIVLGLFSTVLAALIGFILLSICLGLGRLITAWISR